MLERLGLGGVLEFDPSRGIGGMRAAAAETNRFLATFSKIPRTVSSVGAAFDQLGGAALMGGLALAPITAGFGLGIKTAADFEQQMSAVQSVTRGSATDLALLTDEAKRLGAATVFTATQAGAGMEEMARAGFDTTEILSGIGGVLSAAAADAIPLATAAEIVATVLRGMALDADQATRVADVLALTSAKTSSSITSLGEAFKFAAAQSKQMEIDLETTASLLGVISDAGIKGTLAGTSYTNMLVKMADPSEKAQAFFKQHNIEMKKTAKGGLDVIPTLKSINDVLKGTGDVMERSALTTELFGIRGQKAFAAISTAIDQGKVDVLHEQLVKASGTADEMARVRLDNLKGALTLLMSQMEGFSIETAGMFLGPMKEGVAEFSKGIGHVVLALQEMHKVTGMNREEMEKEWGPTAVAVAFGIKQGIDSIIGAFRTARAVISDMIKTFTGQTDTQVIQSIAKIATVAFAILAIVGPILTGFGAIALFIKMVIVPAVTAIGAIFGAVFSGPVLAAIGIGIVIMGFMIATWEEWKAIAQTTIALITELFDFLWTSTILPFWEGFKEVVGTNFEIFRSVANDVMGFISRLFGDLKHTVMTLLNFIRPLWELTFEALGFVAGFILSGVGLAFKALVAVIKPIITLIKTLIQLIAIGVGTALLALAKLIVATGDAVGASGLIPDKLREFSGKNILEFAHNIMEGAPPPVLAESAKANVSAATLATDTLAEQKKSKPQKLEANVAIEDKRTLNLNNKLSVNGRDMALAVAEHKQEIHERAGFKATPWQRRQILETGAAPAAGLASGGGV